VSGQDEPEAPALRVVRGNPTPEEVAALLGVVLAMGSGTPDEPERTSAWVSSARKGRYLPRPSAQAWRLSLRST
jgi:hypothetical protein